MTKKVIHFNNTKLSVITQLHLNRFLYLSKFKKHIASTKTKSNVRGGGKKPWRQKGTGRARAGSIRSPLWVGGGVIFGPHPRTKYKKLNKAQIQLNFANLFLLLNKNFIFFEKYSNNKFVKENFIDFNTYNKLKNLYTFNIILNNKFPFFIQFEIFFSKIFYNLLKTIIKN